MTSAILVPLGQVLGIAFASGLNLYATVAVLGISAQRGWIELPVGLRGLESEIIIITATVLFLLEFVVDKLPPVEWLWDVVHTLVRPLAAALLAAGALGTLGTDTQVAGGILAGVAALAVHGSKAGLRLTMRAASQPWRCRLVSYAEDLSAVIVAILVLVRPESAPLVAGTLLLAVLLFGWRLWRASILGLRALLARVRGFFGRARWRELKEVPTPLRRLLAPRAIGARPPRAARAALDGLNGAGRYRNGWLVLDGDRPYFAYRAGLLGARMLELPASSSGEIRPGPWADHLRLEGEHDGYSVFLLKDGPPADMVQAQLVAAPPVATA